jgi:predicted Zn-dependent protease
MVTFFEKLKKEAEKSGPNIRIVFLSSHPPIEERIKRVKEEIALNAN